MDACRKIGKDRMTKGSAAACTGRVWAPFGPGTSWVSLHHPRTLGAAQEDMRSSGHSSQCVKPTLVSPPCPQQGSCRSSGTDMLTKPTLRHRSWVDSVCSPAPSRLQSPSTVPRPDAQAHRGHKWDSRGLGVHSCDLLWSKAWARPGFCSVSHSTRATASCRTGLAKDRGTVHALRHHLMFGHEMGWELSGPPGRDISQPAPAASPCWLSQPSLCPMEVVRAPHLQIA